jgi:cytochrome c oxidase assembly protein subunit 15
MNAIPRSPGFHRFSLVTLAVGALLVWVGAAVTTTGSGMAFGDWPLSNGSINPSGWLRFTPQFLEHGHRLIAFTVGCLVLAMFLWQWGRAKLGWIVPFGLIGDFLVLIPAVHMADAAAKGLAKDVLSQAIGATGLWVISVVLGVSVFVWLLRGLASQRWPLILKLCAAALVAVVLQAVLGGLRVLDVSDPFGMAHGCLGQLFYCLLIAIALVSSAWWPRGEVLIPAAERRRVVTLTTTLFVFVAVQLLLGAVVRHSQRGGLAATDVLTTGGNVIPPLEPFAVFSIFMHKGWGIVVFCTALTTSWFSGKILRGHGWVSVLPKILAVLPVIQVTLGVYVVLTGKKFWVTNFHVLNGLFILATAFLLMIVARRSRPMSGLIAGAEGTKNGQNASSPLQAGV